MLSYVPERTRLPISPLSLATVFSDWAVVLWRHANAGYWHCDVIFVDCSCTRKLAQNDLHYWITTVNIDFSPPGIHGLACKNIGLVIVGLVDIGPIIQHMVGIGLASIGLVSVSIVNKGLVGTCLYIYFNNVESIGLFKLINRVIVYHILLNFSL